MQRCSATVATLDRLAIDTGQGRRPGRAEAEKKNGGPERKNEFSLFNFPYAQKGRILLYIVKNKKK
jgi:hypothetical protein